MFIEHTNIHTYVYPKLNIFKREKSNTILLRMICSKIVNFRFYDVFTMIEEREGRERESDQKKQSKVEENQIQNALRNKIRT